MDREDAPLQLSSDAVTIRPTLSQPAPSHRILPNRTQKDRDTSARTFAALTDIQKSTHSASALTRLFVSKRRTMKLFSDNIEDLRTLYITNLKKALDMEQKITKALPKMIKESTDPQLAAAFRTHLDETIGHVAKVESLLRDTTGDASTATLSSRSARLRRQRYMPTPTPSSRCSAT